MDVMLSFLFDNFSSDCVSLRSIKTLPFYF